MQVRWRVHELARARGWGARELAEAAGIDQKTARSLLKGTSTRVDVETIARVARALGVGLGPLWEEGIDPVQRWERVAGAAGRARPGEIEEVLAGGLDVETDPALERATRDG